MSARTVLIGSAIGTTFAAGHVTLSPNYGAGSGFYFTTAIKIPHSKEGHFTTRLEVTVPHGVVTVKPEDLPGWTTTIVTKNITPYVSHGKTISTGPAKVIFQADTAGDGLHNDHLKLINLHAKLGCAFDPKEITNSKWQGEYTLWWPMVQRYSLPGSLSHDAEASWTGVATAEDDVWGALLPKPAPYTFMYSRATCTDEQTGEKGMTWGETRIPVKADQEAVTSIEHAKSIANEQVLSVEEALTTRLEALEVVLSDKRVHENFTVTIVALVIAIMAFLQLLVLLVARMCCQKQRYAGWLGVDTYREDSPSKCTHPVETRA